MKVRTGRKNWHTLYLQVGDEPRDDDPFLGVMLSPVVATVVADAINRSGQVRSTLATFIGPERVKNALDMYPSPMELMTETPRTPDVSDR